MEHVAIIGAGELGGAIAHVLARRDTVATIRLIDDTGSLAAGKALDIMQSAPIEGFATRVVGTTDLRSAAGASIFIVADCAARGEWQGDEALTMLRRVSPSARPLVVCAGSTQCDLVERGARELPWPRARIFGSAPEALAAAVRAVVALESNGSARDVGLTVLGRPPSQIVVPWEDATIGGIAATRMLDEPARRRLAARVAPLWPPGPYALASAASKAIDVMAGRSRQLVSCFVAPDDSAGRRTRAAAMPVRLDRSGIVAVEVPPLNVRDRIVLDNATML